jgi:hypothetical protein
MLRARAPVQRAVIEAQIQLQILNPVLAVMSSAEDRPVMGDLSIEEVLV